MKTQLSHVDTVVCIGGKIASWKDYEWDRLKSVYWFDKWAASDVLYRVAAERGIKTPTRDQLVSISNELTASSGDPAILVKMLLEKSTSSTFVLVGISQIGQYLWLREHVRKLVTISLLCDNTIRYQRARYRSAATGKQDTLASEVDFVASEMAQNSWFSKEFFTERLSWQYQGVPSMHAAPSPKDPLWAQRRLDILWFSEYYVFDNGKVVRDRDNALREETSSPRIQTLKSGAWWLPLSLRRSLAEKGKFPPPVVSRGIDTILRRENII